MSAWQLLWTGVLAIVLAAVVVAILRPPVTLAIIIGGIFVLIAWVISISIIDRREKRAEQSNGDGEAR